MLSARYFLLLPFFCYCTGNAADGDASFGPLFHKFRLTLESGNRTEGLSPFYYQQESGEEDDTTRLWAVPPMISFWKNEHTDYQGFDVLWKGITYTRYGEEYRFQVLQLLSFSGGSTQSETDVHRFTLFPFYFQQRSKIPGKDYTALFPIYGTLQQRLFRDEIRFVLFPIYGQTRKRDVVTDNFLYPFFHLRHGDGLSGWQFWPLVGNEHKQVTFKTNSWGDLETVASHRKYFLLWPIFFNQYTGLETQNPAHQQAVLPFYSFVRSPHRDSTSYLWPLGVTHTIDHQKQFTEWGAPWPLIVFARGEGKTTSRVWPFFSQAHNTNYTSEWYLWPIYKYNRLKSDPLDRERTRILFFLYSDLSVKNTETGARLRRRDLWPFFTSKRQLDGRNRLQVLSLLEPFLPNNPSVENNLSPLWSIWRSEENPKNGASSQSLLWNLYRLDAMPDSKKCSLLFGLFQYQSAPDGKRWRLFYIPFGKVKPTDDSGSR